MNPGFVQPAMNLRAMILPLLVLLVSACSAGSDQASGDVDQAAESDAAVSLPVESGLPALSTGVWSIEEIVDRDGQTVPPWEGEDSYSTRVIITNDGEKLMAYDYCGTVPTQVVLTATEENYRADLALDETTSMAACKQTVSSDNATFTPVNETRISVLSRGMDVTLRLTEEECPDFLADDC